MTGTRRALASALLLVTIPALLVAAQAWACVPLSVLTVLPKSSGPAGSMVEVQGENFPGPVEVRWNSTQGQLLASVNKPTAVSRVKVPSTAPGLYTIIMLSRQPDRTVGAIARAPFYVQGRLAAGTEPAASTDQQGVLLVAVIVGLVVVGGFVLLLRRRRSS